MKKLLLFVFLTVLFFSAHAQEPCAFDLNQARLERENPVIKKAREEAEARLMAMDIQKFLKNNGHGSETGKVETIYEIPVVVHLMNNGTTPLRTDAEIIKWIDDCNKFYNLTYGGAWYTAAQGGTVIPFKLVLAKRSPSCSATSGINQINVTATYPNYGTTGLNSSNTNGVTNDQLRALSRWDPQSYYNIYIVNTFDSKSIAETDGLQGYAGFPSNSDAEFDTFMKASVVINAADPTTLPHEFGHSLGLDHPFNNGSTTACPTVTSGGCSVDNDKVCDTPSTKSFLNTALANLPMNGSPNPCDAAGYNNVQYNVMNYTKSNRLFTPGQKNRGLAMFLSNRASLTTSLGATPPPASSPTLVPATCVVNTINTVLGDYDNGPTLVKLGTINNTSEGSTTANANKTYYDYSLTACTNPKVSTSIANTTNPQTITLSCQTNTNIFNVYIDYNNDGAFNETTEKVVADLSVAPNAQANAAFTFPLSGVVYNTALRMRVVAGNASYTSCANNIAREQVEDYMVTITNSVLAVDNTGIKSNRNSIFPNPANEGIFNIKFGDSSVKSAQIAIVDMAGRVIYQTSGTAKNGVLKINSKLSAGNYIVKITTENSTSTEKLIIQ